MLCKSLGLREPLYFNAILQTWSFGKSVPFFSKWQCGKSSMEDKCKTGFDVVRHLMATSHS